MATASWQRQGIIAPIKDAANPAKARIYYADGTVETYENNSVAYSIYAHLPKGMRAAYRAADDLTPVYPHDFVDKH